MTQKYTVKGIMPSSLIGIYGYVSTGDLSKVNDFEYINTQLANSYVKVVASTNGNISQSSINSIESNLKKHSLMGLTQAQTLNQILAVLDAIEAMLIFFSLIAILAASIGIINTEVMSVYERTREIGIEKALGMKNKEVFLLFSMEAMFIGFWGAIIGSSFAITLGLIADKILSETILKQFFGYRILIFNPIYVIAVILGIMAIAFIAGSIPSVRASRINTIEALKYE